MDKVWTWSNLTLDDCKKIHILLQDWAYTGMYGSGEEPATEKQIKYINELGGDAPLGITKKEASRIIKDLQS